MMVRKERVAVVDNPHAGKNSGGPGLADRAKEILRRKLSHRQLDVYQTPDEEELQAAVEKIRQRGVRVVVVMGGDGSIHKYLSHSLPKRLRRDPDSKPPAIIIIPSGTMNTASKHIGLTGLDPMKTLEGIADKLAAGYELDRAYRNALQINEMFGFIYGSGFTAQIIDRYNRYNKRGLVGVVKMSLEVIYEEARSVVAEPRVRSVTERFAAELEFVSDEEGVWLKRSDRFSGMIASTLTEVGFNCRPTYAAVDKLEHFHIVVSRYNFLEVLRNLPALFSGLPLGGNIIDKVIQKATIRYAPGSHAIRMIDGEIYQPGDMPQTDVISMGPRLEFIRS